MELKNSDSRYYFDLIKNVLRLPTSTISALGHTAHISIIAQFRCTLPDTEYAAVKTRFRGGPIVVELVGISHPRINILLIN